LSKLSAGILFGSIAGLIDVIPMLAQKLTWDANLSAFSLWVISGFFIATSELKLPPALKGMVISFLALIPAAFLIAWNNPLNLIPITIMTVILGSALGYSITKFGK
jgi:hypothetical protein